MKKVIALAAGSLALLGGNAFAAGCTYGQKAVMASAHDAVEEPIAEQSRSAELLAKLKKEEEALEQSFVTPIHN